MANTNDVKWVRNTAKAACWGFVAVGAASTLGLAPLAVTVLGKWAAHEAYKHYSRN